MKKLIYFLILLLVFACQSDKAQPQNKVATKTAFNIALKHKQPVSVKPSYLKDIKDWKTYELVEESIIKFYKVSPNEALSNALELKNYVKQLKDSIKPSVFNTPSFKARINVLHNETERLEDISYITAITKEEINLQVSKILEAFSALNAKINIVLSQEEFEREMKATPKNAEKDTIRIQQSK